MFHSRLFRLLALCGIALGMQVAPSRTAEPADPWPGLVQDIFNNHPMNDGNDVLSIEMPYRAEDAAIVPVTLRSKLAPDDTRRLKAITLVIDQNPAPMAAKFEVGPDARVSDASRCSSRVLRVNGRVGFVLAGKTFGCSTTEMMSGA